MEGPAAITNAEEFSINSGILNSAIVLPPRIRAAFFRALSKPKSLTFADVILDIASAMFRPSRPDETLFELTLYLIPSGFCLRPCQRAVFSWKQTRCCLQGVSVPPTQIHPSDPFPCHRPRLVCES